MFGFNVKSYVGIAVGVALAVAAAALWMRFNNLVKARAELTQQVATLTSAVALEKARAETFEHAIDKWEQAAKTQAKALSDFTAVQRTAGQYSRDLKNVLSKHNLDLLAARKPGLVEDRINAGSDRAFRLLEHATKWPADGGAEVAPAGLPADVDADESRGRIVER